MNDNSQTIKEITGKECRLLENQEFETYVIMVGNGRSAREFPHFILELAHRTWSDSPDTGFEARHNPTLGIGAAGISYEIGKEYEEAPIFGAIAALIKNGEPDYSEIKDTEKNAVVILTIISRTRKLLDLLCQHSEDVRAIINGSATTIVERREGGLTIDPMKPFSAEISQSQPKRDK